MSPDPPFETLQVEAQDGVVTALLDRPDRRNAISPLMAGELEALLKRLAGDPEARVLVLRGAGGHFCSGGDLGGAGEARPRSTAATTYELMTRQYGDAAIALHRFPKPTVAAVEGTAAGAGANLAFGCDLVLACEGARFSEIFIRRGLSLDVGGSWLLPRLVGLQKAKELAFFGDWVEAEEACRIGLVNRVFAPVDFDAGVREWATRLAAQAPNALAVIKQSLNRSFGVGFAEAIEQEAVAQGMITSTDDCMEGMRAFLEKRTPRFTGG